MTKKIALVFGLLALMINPAASDTPASPAKVKRVYTLTRNGSKIGTDTVDIDKQGDTTTVKFTTNIAVVIAYITVYKFEHTATEVWNGSQLASFKSQTNDNGTKHTVTVTPAGDKAHIDTDGKGSDTPHKILPLSFWNKNFIPAGAVFAEDDGKQSTVKVSDLGEETLSINGTDHKTRHYRIVGSEEADNRDLWFEGDVLLRLQLKGSDGSKVVSDLQP